VTLSDDQYDAVVFCEQEFLTNAQIPTVARLRAFGFNVEDGFFDNEEVRNSLIARGVRMRSVSGRDSRVLTEQQLTAANVMLDLRDNRSQKKKLSDLGINTQIWEAWLRDPSFNDYLRKRAENILGDNSHEAALALVGRVRSGDTNAIKFYYEITGRYVPQRGNSIDVAGLLMRVLEILQKHVLDDNVITAISNDLINLASGVGLAVGPTRQTPELEAVVDL